MTQKKSTGLKVAAGIIGGLVIGGLGCGFYFDDSNQVNELNSQIADLKNLPVLPAEIVEVPVDNENLEMVLDNLYDNSVEDGESYLDLLTEDLDDDEVNQIVDRIVFINEAKILAASAVDKLDIADELEDSDYNTFNLDEDDIERIRVQDDADEISISDIDFDDKDAIATVKVEFEQDDKDYVAEFEVEFRDGEVDDVEVSKITEQ